MLLYYQHPVCVFYDGLNEVFLPAAWLCFRAQMLMKSRLAGAQKGHSLLKKKADALQMRFRSILNKIVEVGD